MKTFQKERKSLYRKQGILHFVLQYYLTGQRPWFPFRGSLQVSHVTGMQGI